MPDEVVPHLVLRLYEPGAEPSLPPVGAMLSTLDPVERSRAARSANDALRTSFVSGRYLLRALAAELSDAEPARLMSSYHCPACTPATGTGDHGRPRYTLNGVELPLALSLSRSSGHVLLAALPDPCGTRIGVDLETAQDADFDGFGDVALTSYERDAIEGLHPRERLMARARLWARKEALVKALGTGFLGRDPHTFDALRDQRVQDVHEVDGAVVPGRFVAALAVVPPPGHRTNQSGWTV